MYEFIKGTVMFVGPEYIVVENNGIGYQISTPNPFIYSSKMDTIVTVYTYHYVREDLMALYGFETREEKSCLRNYLTYPVSVLKGLWQSLRLVKWNKWFQQLIMRTKASLLNSQVSAKKRRDK